jgi:alkylation response protein AidB-like acyl-CoA dehydrogenase
MVSDATEMTRPGDADTKEDTMHLTDTFEFRNQDYSLDDDTRDVDAMFEQVFDKHSPMSRVRTVAADGFDGELWARVLESGALDMALPDGDGESAAELVQLVAAVRQAGRHLAPVPLVETLTVARLAASGLLTDRETLSTALVDDDGLIAVALHPLHGRPGQAVPGGSCARRVVILDGDRLLLSAVSDGLPRVENPAWLPLGRWDAATSSSDRVVLAEGPAARQAFDYLSSQWRLLAAAYLTGVADAALDQTIDFACVRETRGVKIGALQAMAHSIADADVSRTSARNLVYRAAWFADHEPSVKPELIDVAYLHAVESAAAVTRTAVHVQGGQGVSLESDAALYFLRAEFLPAQAGDPAVRLCALAESVFGHSAPIRRHREKSR